MKVVWSGRGRSALYVGCVYMPTYSTSVAAVDAGYVRLKEDVLPLDKMQRWCYLVISNVHVDNTDVGCSDRFLVWMELGRTAKNFKKEKRVIRRWHLERFDEDEVKLRYQNVLKAEVHGFSESVKSKLEGGHEGI